MTTYYGFATVEGSPSLVRPYQFNLPAVRLEVGQEHLAIVIPGWVRVLYLASTKGFSVPLIEVTAFEQDGCAVKLSFTRREPIWFCPVFLSGSLADLMTLLHSRGLTFHPGRSMSNMGLCSEWRPPTA